MKNLFLKIMLFTGFLNFIGCKSSGDPSSWNDKKIDSWFKEGNWLNGWSIKPDSSINRKEFAVSYFKNRERWDKAFAFLKNNDLPKLETRRYDIDGDNLYAPVSEYITKNTEDAKFEAHRKYIDIQYVISGTEMMGVASSSQLKDILFTYDSAKDLEFMAVKSFRSYRATPDRFFIFFPSDLHRPGVKTDDNSQVKKVVIKLKVD